MNGLDAKIAEIVISQGPWAALFLFMLYYVLREKTKSEKVAQEREAAMQATISNNQQVTAKNQEIIAKNQEALEKCQNTLREVTDTLKTMNRVEDSVNDIKESIAKIEGRMGV